MIKSLLGTSEGDGVALAAIKGLHEMVKEKGAQLADHDTELETLRSENFELRSENAEIKHRLARIEAMMLLLDATSQEGAR